MAPLHLQHLFACALHLTPFLLTQTDILGQLRQMVKKMRPVKISPFQLAQLDIQGLEIYVNNRKLDNKLSRSFLSVFITN